MRTFMATTEGAARAATWYVVDAKGQVLGRLASRIALVLRGKAKPTFTPSVSGDHVIVVNAEKVRLTGKKAQKKIYYKHSGYPSGIRATPAGKLLQQHPEEVLREAVRGMLPKTPLGRDCLRKLRIYKGGTHRHTAQQPTPLELIPARERDR